MKRDSFVFYKSFFDSIKELDFKDQVQIYNAIFIYQFEGQLIELNGICKSIFTLIIPQLEANNKKYINGCKGGRPKNQKITKTKPKNNLEITKTKPKNNLEITKTKPNDNDNDNVNDNDNDIIKENTKRKVFIKPTLEEVEKYCKERNNDVNANKFIDFYESKDWYVGRNKMKDWKACIRTWERRNDDNKPEWFKKNIKQMIATDQEQQEIKEILKNYE